LSSQLIFGLSGDPECHIIYEEVGYNVKLFFLASYFLLPLAPRGSSSSHDSPLPKLLQYVFVFEHDEDGNISLANLQDGNGRARPSAKNNKPTLFSAKKQVSSLLRNIAYVTSTLGNIPEERYVFMKMEFSDDCPGDYQPSGFRDAGDNAVGFFSTKPFSM
jgi:hypothetical protein